MYNAHFHLNEKNPVQILKYKTYNTCTKNVILFTQHIIYYLFRTHCFIVDQKAIFYKAIILRKVLFFFSFVHCIIQLLSFMLVTNNLLKPSEIGFWEKSITYNRYRNVEIFVAHKGKQFLK